MTNLELALQEVGLLDGLLKEAQKAGMTLVDYLRLASTATPAEEKVEAPAAEGSDPVINEIWRRIREEPGYFSKISQEARAQGIDFYDFDGMEARELCQDW